MNAVGTIYVAEGADIDRAEDTAARLGIAICRGEPQTDGNPVLYLTAQGLSLTDGRQTMRGDFTDDIPRLRRNNLGGELLVRAARVKAEQPTALDATAGMGEDSLLLAAAGFHVTMYEYDGVIAELLEDTMRRAAKMPELADAVGRMILVRGDSIEAMKKMTSSPDVILLDPMFPERQKSALVKKKFQLIHRLERPCDVQDEMLNAALALAPKKIVIKRPAKGEFLAGRTPSYSLRGKAIRYDCIVPCER